MPVEQFLKWRQKTILGVSLRVIAPTGQYSPAQLINWGINRWAFKPEFGYSRARSKWVVDGYCGAWFYTQTRRSFIFRVPHRRLRNRSARSKDT